MVLKTHLTLLNTTRLGAAASVLRSKTAAAILEQRRRIEDFNRLTLAVVLSLGALISVVALVCLVLQRRGAHAEYRLQRVALDCSARSELSDQSKALCDAPRRTRRAAVAPASTRRPLRGPSMRALD